MTINVTRTEREAGQMLSNAYARETHLPIKTDSPQPLLGLPVDS